MKISTIKAAALTLGRINISKCADLKMKLRLYDSYARLIPIVKAADESRDVIARKFNSDWADVTPTIAEHRRLGKPLDGYESYLSAEIDANKAVDAIYGEEAEAVEIRAVRLEDFMSSFSKEDLSFEQIANLQEVGVIK